jgi:hypothetical protein
MFKRLTNGIVRNFVSRDFVSRNFVSSITFDSLLSTHCSLLFSEEMH